MSIGKTANRRPTCLYRMYYVYAHLLTILLLLTYTRYIVAEEINHQQATEALRQAVVFFRTQVSIEGGYLWQYSSDLKKREGEGKAAPSMAWVQPPGTPSIGRAYLLAYQRTGDAYYLEAAIETGIALVKGQLKSGGWDYRIEFDTKKREKYAYIADGEFAGTRNTSTLDDNTTQSALSFLIRLDQVLQFQNANIHTAAISGLEALLKSQYPNGAWPQRFADYPKTADFPVRSANYPDSWSRTYPRQDYRGFYTFNDNTIADTIYLMLDAAEIYNQEKYRQSALKAGDFILLAQMPDPQPAWAQQYNPAGQPAWARKFEPPAVTGGESQGVMRTLIQLYRRTGEKKYLDSIPRALDYLQSSLLTDGKLARFYELKTNRPLYFTKQYELVYTDDDLPTHYSFKVSSKLTAIRRQYEAALTLGADLAHPSAREGDQTTTEEPISWSESLAKDAAEAIRIMDDRGAWVENGRLRYHGENDPTRKIISCRTFIQHVDTLSSYLSSTK